jgi:hypothetical protein
MWHRTKRLINSYLDELIERVSAPGREAREVTRAELARLSELEVQTRASAKVLEKELAEIQLKMIGATERERMAREQGDDAAASTAGRLLVSLGEQRDLIRQQITEANTAAERARSLREEHRRLGDDLATQTHLTAMRENLSSVHAPFDSMDPSATLDEMRERIKRSGGSVTDHRVAEADRELEAARSREKVEDMLSRYKQGVTAAETPSQPAPPTTQTATPETTAAGSPSDDDKSDRSKTLGRTDGPVRPID